MLNTYPTFYVPAMRSQQDAHEFWLFCMGNEYIRSSKHAACAQANSEALANVRLLALEQTLLELLQRFNFMHGMWDRHGSLTYVLLRTLDNVMSSTILLVFCVVLVACWFVWTFYQGPWQQYHWYQTMKHMQLSQGTNPNEHQIRVFKQA
jgi:hypothetical protein